MSFSPAPGFFTRQPSVVVTSRIQSPARLVFVNVGGAGDCGFRSVAAGLIDDFLFRRRGTNQQLLTTLLVSFSDCFPQSQPVGYTILERVENMVRSPLAMAQFIDKLAYVLRQIAVDELCEKPERYRGAFIADNGQDVAPEQMRKKNTWITDGGIIIAALSRKLALPIEMQVVTTSQELPQRIPYNVSSGEKPIVVIQSCAGHYKAGVSQGSRFLPISKQPITLEQPVAQGGKDPSLTDIHSSIKARDGYLLDVFKNTVRRLNMMVETGEVSKDDLLAIYVKGMVKSDCLQGGGDYVGTEHGTQHFFEAISRASSGEGVKETGLSSSYDEQVTQGLVDAIAREISLGQRNPEAVFAQIDGQGERMMITPLI